MITNFETHTYELTDAELKYVDALINGLKGKTAQTAIKAPQIVSKMNAWLDSRGSKYRFTEDRLRKYVNYIRANGLLPLMATSKGYYCATSKEEIESQIQSLMERARSIERASNGLQKFL